MEFDLKNLSRCNFTSSFIIHGPILYRFQIFYPHRIEFANTKIMKICNKTKIRVPNVNMGVRNFI